MSPKFLCCLPARFGVFVISLLQFLVCGGFAGFFWWALWYDADNASVNLAKNMKITVIIVASVYTIVALISFIGFVGSILRKYRFIKTFLIMLVISLGFQLATGIWYLVVFYRARNQTLSDCLDGTTNQTKIDYCNALQVFKTYPQGYVLTSVIVPILLQLYACLVVRSYSKYLEREHAEKRQFVPTYQPLSNQEGYPLTQGTHYPYADASNSFGYKA